MRQRWLVWVAVAVAAWVTIGTILTYTDGEPSVPLDDAYIHFQFARGFARFEPFVYTTGSDPVAGATSLLWPAMLAPLFWLNIAGTNVIWGAWLLGFVCLGLLALETYAISERLLSPLVGLGVSAMVLSFGGLTWLAASGMEAVPFAWLWLRSYRRLAEWWETPSGMELEGRLAWELVLLSAATPLMRPEGALASVSVALAFALKRQGKRPGWAALALLGAALPVLVIGIGTGSFSSTTTQVKWLVGNPYLSTGEVGARVLANLRLLYGTLLNGELWSASVVPTGGSFVGALALPALCWHAHRRRCYVRGAVVLVAALGMWIPATYDSFLWNRLRYLWPFAPAWFVAIGAFCELIGDACERIRPGWGGVRALLAGAIAGAFATKMPFAIDDVAESAQAIRAQQASLGRWAHQRLQQNAVIGVNDTGAIAYFSERRTFDVVGLTTRGEAEHWVAGPGSRFEHYQRLPRRVLPTHFIVYPEWFAIDGLLGPPLTERRVHASILGGETMVAYPADYSMLSAGERPLDARDTAQLLDTLDVADLVSEREHAYELFEATVAENQVFRYGELLDGGRASRQKDRFRLRVQAGGTLVVRANARASTPLRVKVGEQATFQTVAPGAWQEPALRLPASVASGTVWVEVEADGEGVDILHYWSYAAPKN